MELTQQDREQIAAAVFAAENRTDAEIVPIFAARSDPYRDAALQWSLLAGVLGLGAFALWHDGLLRLTTAGWEHDWTGSELLMLGLCGFLLCYFAMQLSLRNEALLMRLVPAKTKAGRVRRRAIDYFRVGVEQRTRKRTGVLLYVSLAEHRAEIVVDSKVVAHVEAEAWVAPMDHLIAELRQDHPGLAMVDAIANVGDILEQVFPKTSEDQDELPNKVIIL